MERLTRERMSGIRTGYWSPAKKEELVQRLGEYEDTGLTPERIKQMMLVPTWRNANQEKPLDGLRVLCVTETKKGATNMVIGYWASDLERWVCGMNSNVIKWTYLPEV